MKCPRNPQNPRVEKEKPKKQLCLQGYHDSMHTSPRAELKRKDFYPNPNPKLTLTPTLTSGVLRSGVGTEDHPWQSDCSQGFPKPLLQFCHFVPQNYTWHHLLESGCSSIPNLLHRLHQRAFPDASRTYVSHASWPKVPKSCHIHHCGLEVRGLLGAEETLFLKALKERSQWKPLRHSSPTLSSSPSGLA